MPGPVLNSHEFITQAFRRSVREILEPILLGAIGSRMEDQLMACLKLPGDKSRYSVLNNECIGKECLRLGHYQVRGGTPSGSRNTGQTDPCCMSRAYHGCPSDEKYSPELAQQRKRDGYKQV